ncbi:MAG: AsmA-like C-terminal domain-containing protein [Desulfobacterales bacterium]
MSLKHRFGRPYILGALTVIAILSFLFAGGILAQHRLASESVRARITKAFSDRTGGTVRYRQAEIRWFLRPGVWFSEVEAGIPGRATGKCRQAAVYPGILSLFRGSLQIDKVLLVDPSITLLSTFPRPEGDAAEPTLSLPMPDPNLLPRMNLRIENGRFDISAAVKGTFVVTEVNLKLHHDADRVKARVQSRSNVWDQLNAAAEFDKSTHAIEADGILQGWRPHPLIDRMLSPTGVRMAAGGGTLRVHLDGTIGGQLSMDATVDIPSLGLMRNGKQFNLREGRVSGRVIHSPSLTRIELENVSFSDPMLNLSGMLRMDTEKDDFRLGLEGRSMDVASVRTAALFFLEERRVARHIFRIVRGGTIPRIVFGVEGRKFDDLMDFPRMRLDARLTGGEIFAPGAELDLTDVSGDVRIRDGILEGSDLQAAFDESMGSGGHLRLDFSRDRIPLTLSLNIDADLSRLPEVLLRLIHQPRFVHEVRSVTELSGHAKGTLRLDDWEGEPMKVSVAANDLDLSARYGRVPFPIRIRSGGFSYDGDRVSLSEIRGSVGDTRVKDLSAGIGLQRPFHMTIGSLEAEVSLDQAVGWLSHFSGIQAAIGTDAAATGRASIERAELNGPLLSPKDWNYRANGTLKKVRANSRALPWPISAESAEWQWRPDRIRFTNADIGFLDASARGTATMETDETGLKSCGFAFSGTFGEDALYWVAETAGIQKTYRLKPPVAIQEGRFDWERSGSVLFAGDIKSPEGTLASIELTRTGSVLAIPRLTIEDSDSSAAGAFRLDDRSMTLDFKGHLGGQSLVRLFGEFRFADGFASGDLEARIDLAEPDQSRIQGSLNARSLVIPTVVSPLTHLDQIRIQASGDRLELSEMVCRENGRRHRLEGTVLSGPDGLTVDLSLDSDEIRLPGGGTKARRKAPSVRHLDKFLPVAGTLKARIGNLGIGDLSWSPMTAIVTFRPNGYDLRIHEAEICGLSTPGSIASGNGGWMLRLEPNAEGGDFSKTISCFTDNKAVIDGSYTVSGRLEAHDRDAVLSTLEGPLSLTAEDGRIYRLNLLSKILAVVNVTEIFRGKIPDLLQEGFAYESLSLSGSIEGGVLTIDEAYIDGASMGLAGSGSVDLSTGQSDLTVLVAPFKTVDAIVKRTPIVGYLLGGNLVSIPVKISGDIADPTIIPLDPSAVGSGVVDLMKRTFGLPARLLQPLKDWTGLGDSSDNDSPPDPSP